MPPADIRKGQRLYGKRQPPDAIEFLRRRHSAIALNKDRLQRWMRIGIHTAKLNTDRRGIAVPSLLGDSVEAAPHSGHDALDFLAVLFGGQGPAFLVIEQIVDRTGAELAVDNLDVISADKGGMADATGAAELENFLP